MRPNRWYLAVVTLLLFNGAVNAESEPFPLPSDNRLVVFRYDANQTYTVLAVPGAVTDIAIGDDEELTIAPALGDSVQWRVETAGRHVFVKPIKSDLFTSMTLVTTKRTYQVTLRSSPQGGKWYQRVSWEYPDIIIGQFKQIKHAIEDKRSEDRRLADQIVTERVDYVDWIIEYRATDRVRALTSAWRTAAKGRYEGLPPRLGLFREIAIERPGSRKRILDPLDQGVARVDVHARARVGQTGHALSLTAPASVSPTAPGRPEPLDGAPPGCHPGRRRAGSSTVRAERS